VALTEQVQAPLVTADERRVRALKGKPYRVLSLGEFRPGNPP
jgi:predicted nucleic acid-binding protein